MTRSIARMKRFRADVDLVVFFFHIQAGGGDREALRAGAIFVVFVVIASVGFDDDVFAFVSLHGDATGDRGFDVDGRDGSLSVTTTRSLFEFVF